MCAGHSLHKADWLKIALGLAAAGTGAGALGVGPLAGIMGAGSAAGGVAGDAFLPGALESLATEGGAGAAAGGLAGVNEIGAGAGSRGLLAGLSDYAPMAKKVGKGLMGAQKAGLLGGGQQPTALAAPQPGGGAQTPGAPSSAQIAFPDAYQPAPPYFPLDEILRKRMREGY